MHTETKLPMADEPWNFTAEKICGIVNTIVRAVQPEAVLVFGSRARGDFRDNSDLDLAVVVDAVDAEHPRPNLHGITRDFMAEVSFVVIDARKFAARSREMNTIESEVLQDGVVLYDRRSGTTNTAAIEKIASGRAGASV